MRVPASADLVMRGHQREGGGPDAGAEAEDAEPDVRRLLRIGREAWEGERAHHAASRPS